MHFRHFIHSLEFPFLFSCSFFISGFIAIAHTVKTLTRRNLFSLSTKKRVCFNFSVGSSRADVCNTVEMSMLNRSCRTSSTQPPEVLLHWQHFAWWIQNEKRNRQSQIRWQIPLNRDLVSATNDKCGAKSFLWRCYLLQHNYGKGCYSFSRIYVFFHCRRR